jgi:hypothetical protein
MTFDVKKHLIRIQGNKEYLPVASRLVWFRQEHPDWGIETHPVEINIDKGYAIFQASVYNAEGKIMAKGTKMEFFPKVVAEPYMRKDGSLTEKATVVGFGDYLEKAETGAIGRALAICGFGTQFAPELEEGERIVDSPIPIGQPFLSDEEMVGSKSGSTTGTHACADCGKEMTKGQHDYSVRALGSAYCPSCQRSRVKPK